MKGYKAYNHDLTCNGKTYKENTVFEEESAKICSRGMHFCENPLDTLDYYQLLDSNCRLSAFTEVEALDEVFTDDNKKYCTKKLKIGARLDLKGIIKASFDFLWNKCNIEGNISINDGVKLVSSGDYSQLVSSGDDVKLASSGDGVKLASSGNNLKLASSGDGVKLVSSGDYSQLVSSGDYSQLASSGNNVKLASSGSCSQLVLSGNNVKLASSGDNEKLVSSGSCSQLVSSGGCSKLVIEGEKSVGANIGIYGMIKAIKGSWITLAEYKYDLELNEYICICVKSAQIDGEILKENTWYQLENGEFVEK